MRSPVIKSFAVFLPSRTILRAVAVVLIALTAFLQSAAQVYAAVDPQPGIDCGCQNVGPYEDPTAPAVLATQDPLVSPGSKYTVVIDYGIGQIDSLSVMRMDSNPPRAIVSLGVLPLATHWNFSPDGDRFALYAIRNTISGSQTSYYLYNLTRESNAGVPVWDTLTTMVATQAAFSPNGLYFQYAWVDFGMTYMIILDAQTGQSVFETNFIASPPPSGDEVQVAGWGYSPDDSDRTFVYAYVSSQTVSSVYWAVVNLATGARVREVTIANAVGSQGLLPFWQFSPCGDTIGLALPSGTDTNILLFATKDGAILNPGAGVTTTAALTIKTNPTSHYVDTGTEEVTTLASNTAYASCSGGGGGGTTPRPTGIDCGCVATGAYKNPAAPAPLALKPTDSPHGKYKVVWETGSGELITSLRVYKMSTTPPQLIISLGMLPGSTYWSFSADDDRFALYSIRTTILGSQTSYFVYDLARTTHPDSPVWQTTTPMLDTELAFSPHGRYFQYAWADNAMTYLTIRDARTGELMFQTNFIAAPPPFAGKFRVASWGYSPDAADRTFVYAYVNSQTISSVYLGVVNLAAKTRVYEELLTNAISSQTIQPFWKFSPCGDAIGLVTTMLNSTSTRLFSTKDGTLLNPGGLDLSNIYSLALKNNLTSHLAVAGADTYTLADNTADLACAAAPGTAELKSFTISPESVMGGVGRGSTGTVTLTQAAPSGGLTIDLASDNSAAQVPASVKVPSGYAVATFSVLTSEVSVETTAYITATLTTATTTTTNTATLTVTPPPLASLTMSRHALIAGVTETATATLTDPAPAGGGTIWLSHSGSIQTLNWVKVPEGEKSITFDVKAGLVTGSQQATLTATYLNSQKKITLTILHPSSLAATPAEVTGGAGAVTVTAVLPVEAPEGGVVVPLNCGPSGIIEIPPSLTIEAGQTSGSITASSVAIDENMDVTLLAGMLDDPESPTAVVHVLAAVPSAFPGGPYLALAGQPVTLTGSGTDPKGEPLTFAWDLDGDQTYETAGDTIVFTDTAGHNREIPAWLRACNPSGFCGTGLTFIRVRNPGQVWATGLDPLQDISMPNSLIGLPGTPTPVLIEGFGEVIDVVGGADFAAALKADGTVWTMGDNFKGQLGNPSLPTGWVDGMHAHSSVPVRAEISDVVAIASRGEHVVALKKDGTVWTWGANEGFQLGNGTYDDLAHPTPTMVPGLSGVITIDAVDGITFAMTRKGEIWGWGWGRNIFGEVCWDALDPCKITTIRQAVALQVTHPWAIVLERDGTVWFWGHFDPVTYLDRFYPEQIQGFSGITAISVEGGSDWQGGTLLALKNDGTVWGFGNNEYGGLGTNPSLPLPPGVRADYIGPVQIPNLAGVRAIDTGEYLKVALLQDGTVAGWGRTWGPCGVACGEYWLPKPVQGLANVQAVAVGDDFRLAIIPGTPVSRTATVTVQPDAPATLTLPNGRGQIDFPAGFVSAPTTFTYTEQDAPGQALGSYKFAGLSFTLTAADADGNPVTSFLSSYTMRLAYQERDWQNAGITDESLLNLNYWDTATSQWVNVLPCAGCSLDPAANTLVAALNHLTEFALLAAPETPPAGTTVTVQPDQPATLTLPNDRGEINFPAGLVSVPTTFTYTEQDAPGQALGSDTFAGLSFTLTAADTNGNPVTSFLASYTMKLSYPDSDWQGAGIADESLINLAFWDTSASQWVNVLPCEGCALDLAQNRLVTVLNHLTEFALLASPNTTASTASALVQPDKETSLALPNGQGQIDFPAGLVTAPTTFKYTQQDAPGQALGSYLFAGISFTLTAVDAAGSPLSTFPASYTIRLTYQDSDWQNAGITDESLLNLAYWDTATGQWANLLPCEGCSLNTDTNTLIAVLNHLTEFALLAPTDTTPPTTSASLSPEVGASGWYTGPVTVTLAAVDSGLGVQTTEYNLNGAGWIPYSAPFNVSSESASATAHNTVQYRSTDRAGNLEETQSLTLQIDTTAPSISASLPLSGYAVQGKILFAVSLADPRSGPAGCALALREADGASGKDIGYESLPVTLDRASGSCALAEPFDTTQVPDGFYLLVATARDAAGNEQTALIPFSVRNWAVLELLPATENNKAGRTMPVKFALRVVKEVDPAQPFVYSQELTILITRTGQPTPVLQSATYGSNTKDYRISPAEQQYITNFQTLKAPAQYTVEILRGTLSIGSFGFKTTK